MKPTYKEQFDKLTRAYIHGQVFEMDSCACFVGNLLNNTNQWAFNRLGDFSQPNPVFRPHEDMGSVLDDQYGFYTVQELCDLENCFMNCDQRYVYGKPDHEEYIFKLFAETLELLKQIHITKGEVIEGELVFKKRDLITV